MINNLEKATGSSPLARGTLRGDPGRGSQRRFIPAGAGNTRNLALMPSMMSVHPRWRGEHPIAGDQPKSNCGSSPLARGTLWLSSSLHLRPRFIPAGAGNTCADSRGWSPSTVHPRWRGEHVIVGNLGYITTGSSPLARGTLHRAEPHRRALRFIPAGAGNTAPALSRRPGFSVHPRWRGEHR